MMTDALTLLKELIDVVKDVEMDGWKADRVCRIMYHARQLGIDTSRPSPKLSEVMANIRSDFGAEFDALDVDEFMHMIRPEHRELQDVQR